MEEIRVQKYLSGAGYCSRRKAEELIQEGRITINGRKAVLGDQAEKKDKVLVDGKAVMSKERPVYILLYKPKGVITTTKDPEGRKTVMDLLPGIKTRVFPVGRLDSDTEGLLLLTNDGALTNKLTHPSHQVEKVYKVRCQGHLTKGEAALLEQGLDIREEGYRTAPATIYKVLKMEGQSVVEIGIREGRNRQVRKMFEEIGHPVLALKRKKIGFLTTAGLRRGMYRYLTPQEIEKLKKLEK